MCSREAHTMTNKLVHLVHIQYDCESRSLQNNMARQHFNLFLMGRQNHLMSWEEARYGGSLARIKVTQIGCSISAPPFRNCQGSNSPISNRRAVQFCSKSAVGAHKHTHTLAYDLAPKSKTTHAYPHREALAYTTHTLIPSLLSLSERDLQSDVCGAHEAAKNRNRVDRKTWQKEENSSKLTQYFPD